ncbi:MAG: DUF4105 domain-containing protein [Spirochaetaceae bacterium]|nr:DUF4105 domain-containing protein [Spirochaetaceae bacterium]
MQKTLTISNYRRNNFSRKSVIFSVTLFLLIFNSGVSHATPTLSQDLTRFIFKYFNTLPTNEFCNVVTEEFRKLYYPIDINFIYDNIITNKITAPGDIVRLLENKLKSKQENEYLVDNLKFKNFTKNEWLKYTQNADLYLLYTSENGNKAESSLGHLSLLYKTNRSKYFFLNVGFIAKDFNDEKTGRPTAVNYFRGAFSNLSGAFSIYPFHDTIYQNIILENRILAWYKINVTEIKKNEIDKKIWEINNENDSNYNFFTNNCSSEIIKIIPEVDKIFNRYAFRTPANSIRVLKRNGYIDYVGAYVGEKNEDGTYEINFTEKSTYDRAMSSFNHSFYAKFYHNYSLLSLSLFQLSRPIRGIVFQRSNIRLIEVNTILSQEKVELKSLVPIEVSYNFLLSNHFGLKLDYILQYENRWWNYFNTGLFWSFYNIKIELYNNAEISNSIDNNLNISLLYSNRYIDFVINSNNYFNKQIDISLIAYVYVINEIALMFQIDDDEYSIGFNYKF